MAIGKAIGIEDLEVLHNEEIISVLETRFDSGNSLINLKYNGLDVKISVNEDDSAYHIALHHIKLIDNNTIEDMQKYFGCKKDIRTIESNYIIIDDEVYEPFYKSIEKKIHIAAVDTKTKNFDVTSDILSEFTWKRLDSKKAVYGELNRQLNEHFKQTGEKPVEKYLLKEQTEQYQEAIAHIKEVESRVQ
ncbi:hypothetical protein MKX47_11775 [Solibacillus sp. FSL R7-0668]|uniref:hypothetical protein n=1 Tax=Solibacillus sp. FSL R7-0668 TaxID=2921688 RepID=UPI0030F9C134